MRLIQAYLGHSSPKTTALYTHLTRKADDLVAEAINRVMGDLRLLSSPRFHVAMGHSIGKSMVTGYCPATGGRCVRSSDVAPQLWVDTFITARSATRPNIIIIPVATLCPKCQNEMAQQWLKKQQALLLPVPYFSPTKPGIDPEGVHRRLAKSRRPAIKSPFITNDINGFPLGL